MDFESSSPDEKCRDCGHRRGAHLMREMCGQRGCQWQVLDYESECRTVCRCIAFAVTDVKSADEPKARWEGEFFHEQLVPEALRRPSYAVAYATGGDEEFEVVVPGDATVRAVNGALIITHERPVLALVQTRPMEDA